MPSYCNSTNEKLIDFQYTFLCSEHSKVALEMLTKNNFLPKADVATKRYYFVLKDKRTFKVIVYLNYVLAILFITF